MAENKDAGEDLLCVCTFLHGPPERGSETLTKKCMCWKGNGVLARKAPGQLERPVGAKGELE